MIEHQFDEVLKYQETLFPFLGMSFPSFAKLLRATLKLWPTLQITLMVFL